ncbi:universal stress protein [Roseibium sp.]|uniref:universal stress protein n=1 Tax=Roseibium sp. TaxID=1936156 RepID=UPI0032996899
MATGLKKIVVPVRGDGKGDNVLRHAAVLAHRFNAHIDVTHVRAEAEDMIPFGVAVPEILKRQILESAGSQADVEEQKLKEELHALARELDLTETDTPNGGAATVWFTEERGRQVDMISHLGRLADLIVVPQPDKAARLGANTLKAAIFSSGRPVMMCPDQAAPPAIGARIAIGWNGSIEASRAMRMSMPVIRSADKVSILTTKDADVHRASASDLHQLLNMHGVESDIVEIENRGVIGERLLDAAGNQDADVLVMGAYHEGYTRQEIFGGNAQTVVDKARIPVIMAH